MKKAIDGGKEDMKSILLIGLGRFGRHIAIKLDELNHQVMAVDNNESRVEAVLPYVRNAQIGERPMRILSVHSACAISMSALWRSEIISRVLWKPTSLLKELGAKMVVSRAARDVHAKFLLRNGADEVVYPEKQLASWTAIRYSADHIFDYVELDEEHGIFEISIPDAWIGKTVGELDIRKKYNVNIMALRCNGVLDMNIASETLLGDDQTMLVLGNIKNIQKQFHI